MATVRYKEPRELGMMEMTDAGYWGLYDDATVDRAMEFLRMAVEKWPDDPYPYSCLGEGLERTGHLEEALEQMERALRMAEQTGTRDLAYYQGMVDPRHRGARTIADRPASVLLHGRIGGLPADLSYDRSLIARVPAGGWFAGPRCAHRPMPSRARHPLLPSRSRGFAHPITVCSLSCSRRGERERAPARGTHGCPADSAKVPANQPPERRARCAQIEFTADLFLDVKPVVARDPASCRDAVQRPGRSTAP